MARARPDTWMPLYIGDYLADTMHLSHAQHGIYMLLIMAYWRNGGPLPDDASQLAAIAKCSDAEWRKNHSVIVRFFQIEDRLWRHRRIDAELTSASKNTQARSEAGAEGARKRWQKDGKTGDLPLANASQNDAPLPLPLPKKLASNLDTSSLPRDWAERGAEERAKAGLPEVDLQPQWDRFISKVGSEPTIERWLGWVLKARDAPSNPGRNRGDQLPEAPWEARCRSWAKGQRWLELWGPPPDDPRCYAPPAEIEKAIQQRANPEAIRA